MSALDILFVVFDDMSAIEVEPITMPALYGLGTTGGARVYRRCYSMPVCSQSRACMLYGKYGRHLVPPIIGGMGSLLGPEPASGDVTVAQLLRDADYDTALIGKWHGGRNPLGWTTPAYLGAPEARGFDFWRAGVADNLDDWNLWERVEDDAVSTSSEYVGLAQLQAALEWWSSHESPRFMQVSLSLPHGPYHFPPADELGGFVSVAPSLNRQKYESEKRAADWAFAQLLATVGPSTAVVIVSDNGSPDNARPPGSQPGRNKATAYEGGVRVPMAIRHPSLTPSYTDRLVHIVDIPATLLSMAGLEVPSDWDGKSLTGAARSQALVEAQDGASGGGHLVRAALLDVGASHWKLLRTDTRPEELYHLSTDPGEHTPLSLNDPETAWILANLRAQLEYPAE